LRCVDSNLALYDCDIIGNPGKEPGACGFDPSFSPGGHALHCSGGFLFCSGSTLTGGKGGDGTCCPFTCSAGAEGGSGVLLQAGATEPEAVFLDTTSAGGPGGAGGFCPLGPLCDDGVDGMGYEILAGSGLLLPGNSLSMTASSPIREGGAVTIDVHGPPGVEVFLGIAGEPAFQYYPPLSGVLLAEGPYVFIHLGALPGSGALKTVMPLLFMPPLVESMTFHGQAAYLDPIGAVLLGSPSAVTLLDAAF